MKIESSEIGKWKHRGWMRYLRNSQWIFVDHGHETKKDKKNQTKVVGDKTFPEDSVLVFVFK